MGRLKNFVGSNWKKLALAIALLGSFILYNESCFSLGFVVDCYGPGCFRAFCEKSIFIPLAIFQVMWFIPTFISGLLLQFAGLHVEYADSVATVIGYLVISPIFYFISTLLLKVFDLIYPK